MRLRLLPLASAFLLALVVIPGCGSDDLDSPTATQLKAIGKLYLDFVVSRSGNGPANEQEFKRHLRGMPEHVLTSNGLAPRALDAPFVSERDGEPLVIRYGLRITEISGLSGPLVAYEKTGKNGRRLAGFANGKAEIVDEARLQELLAEKAGSPP